MCRCHRHLVQRIETVTNSKWTPESASAIHAVIGVRYRGPQTYYVQRSDKMEKYPGVWSLLSIQFDPHDLDDPRDLKVVHEVMKKMSRERLGGVPIAVESYLTSGSSDDNPYDGKPVSLHLYKVDFGSEPILNSDYYTGSAWLTAQQYEKRSAGQPCGLCLRLWSDHAWLTGLTDRPFVPMETVSL